MAKKKKPIIRLRCDVCKEINYYTRKSHDAITEGTKLELKKFCANCRKHTLHKETRK